MRYAASEKAEIIRLVEQSHLPVRRTLEMLGIARATFYRWYDRYQKGGPEALGDRSPRPNRVWNRIPEEIRTQIIALALVSLHEGFDGLGRAQDGQALGVYKHFDAARDPGLASDQPGALEGEHHLVHGGRADAKVTLQVSLCRRTPVHPRVSVDEGQVLALLVREARARRGLTHAADPTHGDLDQGGRHEHTLPGRSERGRTLSP